MYLSALAFLVNVSEIVMYSFDVSKEFHSSTLVLGVQHVPHLDAKNMLLAFLSFYFCL